MPRDVDSDGSAVYSSQETQFVPQENDDEVLWKVIEITGEKDKFYKVRWEGNDPETGKPWAQSWVPRHDCTPDLVQAWKDTKARKQSAAQRNKATRKSNGRPSVDSRKSVIGKSSTHSTSTARPQSARTSTNATPTKPSRVTADHASTSKSTIVESKRKRPTEVSDEHPPADRVEEKSGAVPERKKRKINHTETDRPAHEPDVGNLSQDEENDELSDTGRVSKGKGKSSSTLKRKPEPPKATRQPVHTHIITMKTARPGSDRFHTSTTAKRKRIRPARSSSGSSSDDGQPKVPRSPTVRRKAERDRQTVHTSPMHANADQREHPRPLPNPVSPVLSPKTMSRLAEFDVACLNPPRTRSPVPPSPSSVPPITFLSQAPSTASDGSTHVNGHVTTKPPSPKKPNHRPRGLQQSSPSNSRPVEEAPSSTPDMSIVPETDFESSNPGYFDHIPSVPPTPPARRDVQSSPSRPSLVSRMKPKSPAAKGWTSLPASSQPQSPTAAHPHSRTTNVKPKPLRSLPQVPPSVFHQLAEENPPESSVPESRIESDRGLDNVPYSPSPIEHYSSPEKSNKGKLKNGMHETNRKTMRLDANNAVGVDPVTIPGSKKTFERKGAKRSLEELLQAQKELFLASKRAVKSPGKNEAKQDLSSTIADPGSLIPDPAAVEEPSGFQNPVKVTIDLTIDSDEENSFTLPDSPRKQPQGKENDDVPDHIRLRQEEEETTQEAMMYAHGVDTEMGSVDGLESQIEERQEEDSSIEALSASLLADDQEKNQPIGAPLPPIDLVHEDESNSIPLEPSQMEGMDVDAIDPVDKSIEETEEYLLQTDAHEAFEEPDSLASVNAEEVPPNSNEAAVVEPPSDPQVLPSAPSTADLERKIAELQTAFDNEVRSRKSAESDRDFFREQYTQASAFVSEVRSENTDLLERVEIAEKRAVEGVALVKATFQERVRVLEEDVAQARAGYRLLLERERRTGDEIRRRAGEEPELRARCEWLEQRVEDLEMDLEELQAEKENWLNEVEVGKQLGVEEEAKMDEDAEGEEDVEAQMEHQPGISLTETPEDGNEMVHRCQWRADGLNLCDGYFPDVEGLNTHMFLAGHIEE